MEISSKMKLQHSLYEYEVMTAQQLATVHSYQASSIYVYIKKLNKDGLVGKIDVPAIGKGSRAYHLTATAARNVAESRNELSFFKEKDWSTAPSGVLPKLLANQFCCELIIATKDMNDSGVASWQGSRTLLQPFQIAGETKLPPRMNADITFYYDGMVRHIYLNVLTGNESLTVIKEMLHAHKQMIQNERSSNVEKTLFLFLYLGNMGHTILKLWKSEIANIKEHEKIPFLAVANFEKLTEEGIFGAVWRRNDSPEALSLHDMPGQKVASKLERAFIGKKQTVRLRFNRQVPDKKVDKKAKQVHEKSEQPEVSDKVDKHEEVGEESLINESGIDWNFS